MSIFFPTPKHCVISQGIDSLEFTCGETAIIVSTISSGACVRPHRHSESQFGLSLSGSFEISIEGEKKILSPLENAYFIGPEVLHSAKNLSSGAAVGLDVKRKTLQKREFKFLKPTDEKELKTGLTLSFFVGSWIEVMVARIPPGGKMNLHKHKHEQIGIAVSGKYIMTVGEESQEFKYGKVYFAPSNEFHGAYNPFPEEACSVNLFMPPRYNKSISHL